MIVIRRLSLERDSLGARLMQCAHCGKLQPLARHRLLSRLPDGSGEFQEGEGLVCPSCAKVSRAEGWAGRLASLVFLAPFSLLLLGGVATGCWFAVTMMLAHAVDGGFLFLAALLIGVAGWGLLRTSRTIYKVAHPQRTLPLENLLTDIR